MTYTSITSNIFAGEQVLYIINLETEKLERVGNVNNFGIDIRRRGVSRGLTSHNGKLYRLTDQLPGLFTLNTTNGTAQIERVAGNFGIGEGLPGGIASRTLLKSLIGGDAEYSNLSVCPQGSFLVGVGTNGITCRTPN